MREPVTEEQLAKWEQLAEAATRGPWHVEPLTGRDSHLSNVLTKPGGAELLEYCPPPDAEFCAAAREAVPALIEEVKRQRAAAELRRIESSQNNEVFEATCARLIELDAEVARLREALEARHA